MEKKSVDFFAELSETEKKQARLKGVIAAAIEDKRHELTMSQTDFAKKLGCTQGMVSKLESTEYNMSMDKLIEILDSIDIPYSFCINGKQCISNSLTEYQGVEYRPYPGFSLSDYPATHIHLSEVA